MECKMSVLKSRRKESSVQFLDTAREIEVYTIKQCSRFPKRYMFLLTKDLVELSKSIYNNTKSANSIYPTNKEEFLIRMEYNLGANCDLQCLISQLDVAKEFITTTEKEKPIKSKVFEDWAELLIEEQRLLSGLKKADRERYKDLQ